MGKKPVELLRKLRAGQQTKGGTEKAPWQTEEKGKETIIKVQVTLFPACTYRIKLLNSWETGPSL